MDIYKFTVRSWYIIIASAVLGYGVYLLLCRFWRDCDDAIFLACVSFFVFILLFVQLRLHIVGLYPNCGEYISSFFQSFLSGSEYWPVIKWPVYC